MTFYKVMSEDDELVGYADSSALRVYQPKHKALLFSDESRAQFVQIGETVYRDGWLHPLTEKVPFEKAKIVAMGREEYERELGGGTM